ncbi:hypothetical protein NOVO_05255 [Rickettsiales bacterium Ac37b]|nr:hypothetical protein NOVO_05255 [Rickettsiales bacterium Ac37b]
MIQLLGTNDSSDYLEVITYNNSTSKSYDSIYRLYLEDHFMLEEPDYLEENIISNAGQYTQVNQEINLPLAIATSTVLKYKYGLVGLIAIPGTWGVYKLAQGIKNFLSNEEPHKVENIAAAELLQSKPNIYNNLWDHDHDTKHFGGKKFSRDLSIKSELESNITLDTYKLHLCNIANNEYNIIIFFKIDPYVIKKIGGKDTNMTCTEYTVEEIMKQNVFDGNKIVNIVGYNDDISNDVEKSFRDKIIDVIEHLDSKQKLLIRYICASWLFYDIHEYFCKVNEYQAFFMLVSSQCVFKDYNYLNQYILFEEIGAKILDDNIVDRFIFQISSTINMGIIYAHIYNKNYHDVFNNEHVTTKGITYNRALELYWEIVNSDKSLVQITSQHIKDRYHKISVAPLLQAGYDNYIYVDNYYAQQNILSILVSLAKNPKSYSETQKPQITSLLKNYQKKVWISHKIFLSNILLIPLLQLYMLRIILWFRS